MYYVFSILAGNSETKGFCIILQRTFKVVGKFSLVIWIKYEQFFRFITS